MPSCSASLRSESGVPASSAWPKNQIDKAVIGALALELEGHPHAGILVDRYTSCKSK
ncbi:hypothetical protein ACFSKM_25520 [Ancylobacter dichloromethanicus]